MEKEILVVIGHRLGKGQNVAKGIEAAGGKAIVIPGMAADMKLGDVMKENNATFGISNLKYKNSRTTVHCRMNRSPQSWHGSIVVRRKVISATCRRQRYGLSSRDGTTPRSSGRKNQI